MAVAYWSIKLEVGKKPVEVQPPEGYVLNVQIAALANATSGFKTIQVDTISIEGEPLESTIGTLRAGKTEQMQVQLVFGFDVPVKFSVTGDGPGVVYLSGYYQPGPEDDDDDDEGAYGFDEDDDDDDSDDDEGEAQENPKVEVLSEKQHGKASDKKKGGKVADVTVDKKGKVVVPEVDSDDSSSDEDEEDGDEIDAEFVKKMMEQAGAGDDAGVESEESQDSDEESDEEPPAKVQKSTPKGFNPKAQQQQAQAGQKGKPNQKPNQKPPQQHQQHQQQQKGGQKGGGKPHQQPNSGKKGGNPSAGQKRKH